jgi:hypothetical protein
MRGTGIFEPFRSCEFTAFTYLQTDCRIGDRSEAPASNARVSSFDVSTNCPRHIRTEYELALISGVEFSIDAGKGCAYYASERWLSGRKRRFAKSVKGSNPSAGSNPVLSACFLTPFSSR